MLTALVCVLTAVVLAVPHPAAAGQTVTLAEFLDSALAFHPDVERSALALKEAEADLAAVRHEPHLTLDLNLGYYRIPTWQQNQGSWTAGLSLGSSRFDSEFRLTADLKGKTVQFQLVHPLFAPVRLSPYRQKVVNSEHIYKREMIAHQMVLEEVFLSAARCFLNIWRLQEEARIRQSMIAWLGSQLEITAAACASETAHELDFAFAQLRYEHQINALEKVRGELAAERMLAAKVYGVSPEVELTHDPAVFTPVLLEPLLERQAPAVALAELNYDRAEMEMEAVKASMGIQSELRLNILSDHSWSVEFSLRVPLLDPVYRVQSTEAACVTLAQALLEKERAESEIVCEKIYRRADLDAASNNLKTAVAASDLAVRQRRIAEKQYALGLLSFLDLLRIYEEEADAHLGMANAQYEHQLALIRHWVLDRSPKDD